MNINWKLRFKNPTWWAEIVAAILFPLIIGVGANWEEMTSWATLFDTICAALGNPIVVCSMLVSAWNAITDPTTSGISDSELAMTYDAPKCKDKEIEGC